MKRTTGGWKTPINSNPPASTHFGIGFWAVLQFCSLVNDKREIFAHPGQSGYKSQDWWVWWYIGSNTSAVAIHWWTQYYASRVVVCSLASNICATRDASLNVKYAIILYCASLFFLSDLLLLSSDHLKSKRFMIEHHLFTSTRTILGEEKLIDQRTYMEHMAGDFLQSP